MFRTLLDICWKMGAHWTKVTQQTFHCPCLSSSHFGILSPSSDDTCAFCDPWSLSAHWEYVLGLCNDNFASKNMPPPSHRASAGVHWQPSAEPAHKTFWIHLNPFEKSLMSLMWVGRRKQNGWPSWTESKIKLFMNLPYGAKQGHWSLASLD